MPVRHIFASSALLLGCLLVPGRRSVAQSTTSLLTDGTVLPRRTLAIRLPIGWTRFDQLLGNGGSRNLGASFATDSLTGGQIQQLSYTESLIRQLSGASAFHLTAGTVVAGANSRIVTAPLIAEFGLTSRLTIGVVIPLVETRSTVVAQLNPHPGLANVGPNPGIIGNTWTTNAALVASFRTAATALQTRLTQCQASPASAGCPALLAQQSSAQSLIQSTGPLAAALEALYGTGQGQPGLFFVPLDTGATQKAINAQITALRTQYQTFGGTVASGVPTGAGGSGAQNQLQAILKAAGYDTLRSPDHASIGDISIGATYQLANTFGDTTEASGLRYRFAVNGTFRIGTGQPANRRRLFDNATGYGQHGVIVGAGGDFQFTRRYSLTALGSYTAQLGSVDAARVPNTNNSVFPLTLPLGGTYKAGNVLALTFVPRIRVAGLFSIDGHYAMTRIGADEYKLPVNIGPVDVNPAAIANLFPVSPYGAAAATTQQIGFGFSYSTIVGADRGPGRIPYEVSFRHLETLNASGGPVPKTFQDQLQLRVFFR